MTCKDCIHYDMCEILPFDEDAGEKCEHFKDKSRFIELPCKVGNMAYQVEFEYGCAAKNSDCFFGNCGECGFSKRISVVKEIKMYSLNDIFYWYSYFGKIIFATRDEAEKAVKERENNA